MTTTLEIEHRPRRTGSGDPAHGCEMCDGMDVCTCPHKQSRAQCLGCGGSWPECADPQPRPIFLIKDLTDEQHQAYQKLRCGGCPGGGMGFVDEASHIRHHDEVFARTVLKIS